MKEWTYGPTQCLKFILAYALIPLQGQTLDDVKVYASI